MSTENEVSRAEGALHTAWPCSSYTYIYIYRLIDRYVCMYYVWMQACMSVCMYVYSEGSVFEISLSISPYHPLPSNALSLEPSNTLNSYQF